LRILKARRNPLSPGFSSKADVWEKEIDEKG